MNVVEETIRLHKLWLNGKSEGVRANLYGANLSRANLRRANLSGANLRRADLSRADLHEADLSGANLSGANLRRADLSRADLHEADLSGANLRGADLSESNLYGADLCGANLSGANLSGANLIVGPVCHGYLIVCEKGSGGAVRVRAGCQKMTMRQAHTYWSSKPDRVDALPALDYLEACARQRGWL